MHDETRRVEPELAQAPRHDRRALAALAFGAESEAPADPNRSFGRHLAILPPDALDLDLDDPAQRAFGDYELLEKLGQGGMGVVYRARQRSLEREVAIKLLAAGPWASPDFIDRFRREAQSAAHMQHPNIVAIYEIGSQEDLNYFSMQLVRGPTLAEVLREQGRPPARTTARLMRFLAEAVDYAHRLGVLHLDLKPGNVLLDDQRRTPWDEAGVPLIADFGLARRLDESLSADSDEISGTPSYMAPEQAQPRARKLTPATDIYGLGAILYELLTGRPPHMARSSQETLRKVLGERPALPRSIAPDVSRDLEAICLKCLEPAPGDRYRDARQLADDLGRHLDNRAVSVRVPPLGERVVRWTRREPRLAMVTAVLALTLLGGLVLTAVLWQRSEEARAVAEAQRVDAVAQREVAERQAERMRQATRMMAELFPDSGDEAALREQARRAIEWLRQEARRSAGGEEEILEEFTRALIDSGKETAAGLLVEEISAQLGDSYRGTLVAALEGRSDPRSLLAAAILQMDGDTADPEQDRAVRLFERAQRSAADDVLVQFAVALYCAPPAPAGCAGDAALARLTQLAPDDAGTWLLVLAHRSGDRAAQREALSRAARSARLDDRMAVMQRLLMDSAARSNISVTRELLPGFRGQGGDDAVIEAVAASVAVFAVRFLPYRPLTDLCRPPAAGPMDRGLRDDCLAVALMAARAPAGAVTNMLGANVARRLARGGDVEREMVERRRRYLWLQKTAPTHVLLESQQELERFLDDFAQLGEVEAHAALAVRRGLDPSLPADWQPDDPDALLLPENRPAAQ
jgi:hypothetical protein